MISTCAQLYRGRGGRTKGGEGREGGREGVVLM